MNYQHENNCIPVSFSRVDPTSEDYSQLNNSIEQFLHASWILARPGIVSFKVKKNKKYKSFGVAKTLYPSTLSAYFRKNFRFYLKKRVDAIDKV